MNRFGLPPQILRLVLLTALIVGTYAVARTLLTPATFGQYGHYRGAALEETASRKPLFAGAKACDECHSDVSEKATKGHKLISCESCHSASSAHVRNPDITTVKLTDNSCLRCHSSDPARPARHKQVTTIEHYPGDHCIECHLPHQPNKSP
ncbi:MAG: hypothetical protein Q7S40_26360 [Opitutaceae bacterium]|nr:hypothetical protein [Opitutaceae bacterium]